MKAIPPEDLLGPALTCFAQRGLQGTSIDYLTQTLGVSHRVFYDVLGNKAAAIEAVYQYATTLLLAEQPTPPPAWERLQGYLDRWWHRTAAAAQTHPQAFTFWQYYRTSPHVAGQSVLGPFSPIADLIAQTLARPGTYAPGALPPAVLSRSLAAQWTAAVEVVLAEPACQASASLRQRVLTHAYTSWWQGLGLPQNLLVAVGKTPPPSPLMELLGNALAERFGPTPAAPVPKPGK